MAIAICDTKPYVHGTHHLRVYFRWRGEDCCAVLHSAGRAVVDLTIDHHVNLLERSVGDERLLVLVGTVEYTQDCQGVPVRGFRLLPKPP